MSMALFQKSSLENRSWGDIMDELDNEMENLQPFCIYDPWSMNTISQVEEQKVEEHIPIEMEVVEQIVEERKVDKQMVNGKKVEEKKEQAEVQQQPARTHKLPKERLSKNTKSVTLLLKNLDCTVDDRNLYEAFLIFGTVLNAQVKMENGRSKGIGYVTFSSPDEARAAIVEMNGRVLGSRPVYVSPSQTTQGRSHGMKVETISPSKPCPDPRPNANKNIHPQNSVPDLGKKNQQQWNRQSTPQPLGLDTQEVELFVKNLDYGVDQNRLRDLFLPHGNLTSAKVVLHNGRSKGIGFVRFSSLDEANNAIRELNGKLVSGRPLCITMAKQWTGGSRPTKPYIHPSRNMHWFHPQRHRSVGLFS
ncbi:polyadenylate-binding protein 3-like isoform X2 [Silurus meridionalis]|uniref:polyadenylate-binding protein 3-like isoform X2 n=1 Tax=Silurus meridionalis TaxID=175797 RepID=UPI001EEB74D1|nr:polyadenylate-binding protein 3-like isoform X2 [Silurus meridionalis]